MSSFDSVPFMTARTDCSTRSGVISFMQTLSLQAEFFWLAAVTQGEHDNAVQIASELPRLP